MFTIIVGFVAFVLGIISASVMAMGSRMSDIEERERAEWAAEHVQETPL